MNSGPTVFELDLVSHLDRCLEIFRKSLYEDGMASRISMDEKREFEESLSRCRRLVELGALRRQYAQDHPRGDS